MNIIPEPRPSHVEDLTGRRFGRWTVVGYASYSPSGRQAYHTWRCRCGCGWQGAVIHHNLIGGRSKRCASCGHRKHGLSNTPTYDAWRNVKRDLCDSWNLSFATFFSYLGLKPPGSIKLRRHDKSKPHGPGNSYWGQRMQTEGERRESLEADVEATLDAMRRATPGLNVPATRARLRSVTRQRRHQIRSKAMKESKPIFTTHPVTGPLRDAVKESNGGSLLQIERETGVPLSTVATSPVIESSAAASVK